MNGELAHAITLAAFGNALLAGDRTARRGLDRDQAVFQITEVRFERGVALVTADPVAWIDDLRARGATRLRALDVAGSGGVVLAANTHPHPEEWTAEWEFAEARRTSGSRRVWDVVYRAGVTRLGPRRTAPPAPPRAALATAAQALREALETMIRVEGPTRWTTNDFAPALAVLAGTRAVPPLVADALPERGYGATARRLFAAAVLPLGLFGGMGSWNGQDHGDRNAEWEELSAQLFAASRAALLAAVNAFGAEA